METDSTFNRLNPLSSVIDIGCGSGILSIAALNLGAQTALGVDIDIESVSNSRENADKNGIGAEFVLGQGSVAEVKAGQFAFASAPLVVANILAPVIIRLFEAGLADLVEAGRHGHPERDPSEQAEKVSRGRAGQRSGFDRATSDGGLGCAGLSKT